MNFILDFISNYALQCAFIAWFAAQFLKILLNLFTNKKLDMSLLYSSGGMPSSHSSSVCAMTTAIALDVGVDSSVFAIAFVISIIVMYDAAGVRRASGEHAKLLNIIVKDIFEGKPIPSKEFNELIGHTPLQVLCGAVLGVLVSLLIYLIRF